MSKLPPNTLSVVRLGILTQNEHFAYMREDCHVCVSEGFEALTRIRINCGQGSIVANLNVIRSEIIRPGQIGLSESAIHSLDVRNGESITVSHLSSLNSLAHLRSKIYGNELSPDQFDEMVKDIVDGSYSNIHLAAFVASCGGQRLTTSEIISLTRAMIFTGEQLHWKENLVVDKHCIGGLPGNRTTPIVVAIVTSFGLMMPKTSSRAITSPAGTADTMEVLTEVSLNADQIERVVEKEGGCLAWGGTANLSPADDILIRVEKALDIDSEGQLIASVLSKKVAAGSSHVVIDMPVGQTAKLRDKTAADRLKIEMEKVAEAIGIELKIILTDGSQPVGKGIGPSLEARDVLSVLRNESKGPEDLKERSVMLAGELLELSGRVPNGKGRILATQILESGAAYRKFEAICVAQGGMKEPVQGLFSQEIKSDSSGTVSSIDNRRLAKLAKLAGAPSEKSAGIDFLTPIGTKVRKGQVLYIVYAATIGELNYALEYQNARKGIITID